METVTKKAGRAGSQGDEALILEEANQGLAHRIDPCVLRSDDVDCDDIVDLRTPEDQAEAGIRFQDMASAWMDFLSGGKRPPSWATYDRPAGQGTAGFLVSSLHRAPMHPMRTSYFGARARDCRIASR